MNCETKRRQRLAEQLRTLALQVLDHGHALPDLLTVEVIDPFGAEDCDTLTEAAELRAEMLADAHPFDTVRVRVSFTLEADHAGD